MRSGGVPSCSQPRRAPDVAVVVADDEVAAPGQLLAEVLVPGEHLRAQAHDQQHRRVGRVAERLVTDLDVADGAEGLHHESVTCRRVPERRTDVQVGGRTLAVVEDGDLAGRARRLPPRHARLRAALPPLGGGRARARRPADRLRPRRLRRLGPQRRAAAWPTWPRDIAALADALGLDRFATWGASGGGPHALACAALLGDRVVAAATFAGAGPSDQPDLDFTAGMGEENVEEFGLAHGGRGQAAPAARAVRRDDARDDARADGRRDAHAAQPARPRGADRRAGRVPAPHVPRGQRARRRRLAGRRPGVHPPLGLRRRATSRSPYSSGRAPRT